MNTIRKHKILKCRAAIFALSVCAGNAHAFAPTNFFVPYDPNLRLPSVQDETFRLGLNLEYGSAHSGRNWDGHKANVLQLYDATEATLPMLMNPTTTLTASHAEVATLLQKWTAAPTYPNDDGIRGHIAFTGEFSQIDATLCGSYNLPLQLETGQISLDGYLPLRNTEVKNIEFVDQTKRIMNADLMVHEDLTDNLATRLTELGDIDIHHSSLSGIGDLVIMLNWHNVYNQNNESLKNVELFGKIGLSIPTGQQRKVDKVFSIPLGNDGAWGMPMGLGIALEYDYNIRLGADVDFLILFDKTKTRRLKTEEHQTDFLLLNKGKATKDHGLTWKFNLYAQGYRFWRGLSTKATYEYIKHDDDRLTAKSDEFSYHVINTATSLKEWNTHALIFSLNYDFIHECEKSGIIPQVNIFYKLPIAGKRVINPETFGGQIAVNF